MPPRKHAKLSASSAYRWIHCPGSVALSEQCPAPPENEFAAEGTVAHELAEQKLRRAQGEISQKQFDTRLTKIQASEFYCAEMEEATDYYRDAVLEALAGAGEDATLLIEQRVDFSQWVAQGFGTSDAVIIGTGTLRVIDLKYGKGIRVDAEENPQLRLYGLGAVALFGDIYDIDTVQTCIIQPRIDHVSVEELSLQDLLEWCQNVVVPKAALAMDGTNETASGDWCHWCPAKAICRTRAEKNLEAAKYEFRKPALLTPPEIADVLSRAEELQKWSADVSAYALEQALAGQRYAGWKLVEGRSNRKYADERKVAEALETAGFDEAMLYERKLYGVSAMEKMVGKKKFSEILGDLIVKPAGKPVLVPESDKRDAINTAEAAKADFS